MNYRVGRLRFMTFNVHMGQSMRNGRKGRPRWSTLGKLVRFRRPHIINLQEVARADLDLARACLGRGYGLCGEGDSAIGYRRRRFILETFRAPDNRHGETNGARTAARIRLTDKRTGRVVLDQSVHCQPLGKGLAKSHPGARTRQTRQLSTFADASSKAPAGAVVVDGGDFNQDMGDEPTSLPVEIRPHTAQAIWAQAGMVPAHTLAKNPATVNLDEFMVRPAGYVEVIRHVSVPTHGHGDDHPAVFMTLLVQPKETP